VGKARGPPSRPLSVARAEAAGRGLPARAPGCDPRPGRPLAEGAWRGGRLRFSRAASTTVWSLKCASATRPNFRDSRPPNDPPAADCNICALADGLAQAERVPGYVVFCRIVQFAEFANWFSTCSARGGYSVSRSRLGDSNDPGSLHRDRNQLAALVFVPAECGATTIPYQGALGLIGDPSCRCSRSGACLAPAGLCWASAAEHPRRVRGRGVGHHMRGAWSPARATAHLCSFCRSSQHCGVLESRRT
jgi:hypothetical protein